ncbi:MAG: choice-of-anchor I family protein, partial [Pyrinomonadaceae bacterium]|nr:choice-of-anchor I family protein [Pyrinomonadaceae bacterium]
DGTFLSSVQVGAIPDMLVFTPDGEKVLVANEAEPSTDYLNDPEGSVSIIDLRIGKSRFNYPPFQRGVANITQADVTTAGFTAFNSTPLDSSIRIFGVNATVAKDLEPEYITISADSQTAWVTLQENNAIGILDISQGAFTSLKGLGFKNHQLAGNSLDASDRDGAGGAGLINIANWPVFGMYQPDAIASYRYQGNTYLVTANEGDAREYTALTEERRISALTLDATAFPNAAALQSNAQLGRLNVTNTRGDTKGDGDFDALYVFGARSFSIWDAQVTQVFDSGNQFEQRTATALPTFFNSNHDSNASFDTRSDNKGPEPEGVVIGEMFGGAYAFIGLERVGGIMVYDISNPVNPRFVQYINNRNFAGNPGTGTAGDLAPEGLIFIPASQSPNGQPLLVSANEVSGTVTIFQIQQAP